MARNDPYFPPPVNVSAGGTTTFDASGTETGTAIVNQLGATFDATITLEAYDGSAWQKWSAIRTSSDEETFIADWHTQFNRVYISTNDRRIQVENVDTAAGYVAIDGDER